jgi:hypothetical protein
MATMTQPEQEAREVLAAEYDEIGDGLNALRIRSGSYVCEEVDVALSALTKALARPTAGIDREVVARLIREHHAVEYGEDGTWSGTARHIGDYKAADAILALHAPPPQKPGSGVLLSRSAARVADERRCWPQSAIRRERASINASKAVARPKRSQPQSAPSRNRCQTLLSSAGRGEHGRRLRL